MPREALGNSQETIRRITLREFFSRSELDDDQAARVSNT